MAEKKKILYGTVVYRFMIHGLPVKSIEFFTAENQRKEA